MFKEDLSFNKLVTKEDFSGVTENDYDNVFSAVTSVFFNKNISLQAKGLYAILIFIDDINKLNVTTTINYVSNGQTSITRAWNDLKKLNIVDREMNREGNKTVWSTILKFPDKKVIDKQREEYLIPNIQGFDDREGKKIPMNKSEIYEEAKEVMFCDTLSLNAKGLYAMLLFIDDPNELSVTNTFELTANGQSSIARTWKELSQAELIIREIDRKNKDRQKMFEWRTILLRPNADFLKKFSMNNASKSKK